MASNVNSRSDSSVRVDPRVRTDTTGSQSSRSGSGAVEVTQRQRTGSGTRVQPSGNQVQARQQQGSSSESIVDAIAQEELARAAEERRKARESEEKRRREEAERRRDSASRVDTIAGQEVARAAGLRSATREAQQAGARRLDQIASEEYSDAMAAANRRNTNAANAAAASAAAEAASNARLDQIADNALQELVADVDSQRAAENARRAAAAREQAAANRRTDARTDKAMRELMEEQRRDEAERDRRESSSERAVELSARRNVDIEDQIISDIIRELREQGESDREISRLIDEIAEEELSRAGFERLLKRIREAGLGMQEREPVTRETMDERLPRILSAEEIAARVPQVPAMSTSEFARGYIDSTNEMLEERANSQGIRTESRGYVRQVTGTEPPGFDEDVLFDRGYDVTGRKREDWEKIVNRAESKRTRDAYREAKIGFDPNEGESSFMEKVRRNANRMIRRFYNPSLVHIDGERLESHTEEVNGRTRTFAKRVYTERVQHMIDAVRDIYDCSVSDVLRLLQLRAGLGIGSDGTIAGVNPNEFRLTEDQAVELLRDIVESQRVNGHPLGPVNGMPAGNNVRDDTGRFVIVAGTRCFPLGYMPKSLISSLSRNWGSDLHGLTEQQIQRMVGEQWINETYPQLCANTSGNSMAQARAIECMMRAMMSIDGMNPNDLNIPDVVENRMLMQMRTEQQVTEDEHIAEANMVKHEREMEDLERFKNRHMKTSQVRNSDGELESVSTRRFHGDRFRTISSLERSAKAANLMIMISSVPESVVANAEQGVANFISNWMFNETHNGAMADYGVTTKLLYASQSREAIEAHSVAESLYRIGGHTALNAFINEMGDDGKHANRFTNADLRAFLARMGVTNGNISDEGKKMFGLVSRGDMQGFLSNAQAFLDGVMLSDGMFRDNASEQFVKMGMAEMARSSLRGRESYTSAQVEQWVSHGGGEELIRSMLMTDAGREAFMTQGVTSLGRKSPVEHLMRRVMSANGLTEFAVRTLFDRFPEYGVNKIMQMVPYSNTISYLASRGISSMGDMLALSASEADSNTVTNASERLGREMSRARDYQMGGRLDFFEGLRKNLWYDTVMAGEKLLVAGVYAGAMLALGGVYPPDDDRDIFTWSEWKIGSGDDAVPIKWAWWMDDLSGVGLPLGMCLALYQQYGWDAKINTVGVDGPTSRSVRDIAVSLFINSVANLNNGSAVFDMIDFVNNPEEEFAAALDDTGSFDPTRDEKWMSMLERGFWGVIGDLTPTIIGQLIPWSKDFIGRTGADDAHTPYRIYDTNGRTKAEAEEEYKTTTTTSYSDTMRRRDTQSNVLYALWMDYIATDAWKSDSDVTGYKYTEQPLDTMVDPYAQGMFDRFYLDLDPATSSIPINDQEAREAALDEHAEDVVQWIDEHYKNATQASLDGFVLNYDARVNCINYCHKMINQAWQDYYDALDNGWLEDEAYERVVKNRQDTIDHYNNIIYNFLQSDEIGWTLPRYKRKESDMETRYVDEQGRPMTYLDTLGENPRARTERYWYGNTNDILPFISPNTEGKGRNFETIPYNIVLDENGNPVNDVESMYDNAALMDAIAMGRLTGKDVQELMWGGQGTNLKDDVLEQLAIPRGGVPTLGGSGGSGSGRPWELLESSVPEASGIGSLTAEQFKELLGIESSAPVDGKYAAQKAHDDAEASGGGSALDWYDSYDSSYGGNSYSYGGGYSGGSSYEYNPRIYNTSRSVYSSKPSGMSTRSPYKATNTYLRPAFYTKGSREAYRRQD